MTVVLIGYGNVGQHLYKALSKSKEVSVLQVCSPSVPEGRKGNTQFINSLSDVTLADLYMMAVNDDLIIELSQRIPVAGQLLVHTSGTVSLEAIDGKNRKGVFYPLQTFSSETKIDFKSVPICLEAQDPKDLKILKKLAKVLSTKVVTLTSEERKRLHMAAVWVNNFANHLFHMAEEYLNDHQLPFSLLKPLILETAQKVQYISPSEAQTGPAKRNDRSTIEAHLALLDHPKQKEIYKLLTESIQEHFNLNK